MRHLRFEQDLLTLQRRITTLKQELAEVRAASLEATRQGNFREVARLTLAAASINKALFSADGPYQDKYYL